MHDVALAPDPPARPVELHHSVRAVIEHIDVRAHEPLTVEDLGEVACMSTHHLHRVFSRACGVTLSDFVRLVRLERAGWELAFRSGTVIEVGLQNGYGSNEAFSRAFKRVVGQTPSAFRSSPDWGRWREAFRPLHDARAAVGVVRDLGDVSFVRFVRTPVAMIEHTGPPDTIGDTLQRFIAWRRQVGLSPRLSATYNLVVNDPIVHPPEHPRFAICVATLRDVPANDLGIRSGVIPGGRCAVLRHVGSDATLVSAAPWLATTWLHASGEQRRSDPVFLRRVRALPDVAARDAVTDIFLPLESSPAGEADDR